jgi:hypothetical protein
MKTFIVWNTRKQEFITQAASEIRAIQNAMLQSDSHLASYQWHAAPIEIYSDAVQSKLYNNAVTI